MALETITGNLLAYKQLEPGTFQHVDQITTERRVNLGLRDRCFYTADGQLYTIQNGKHLWVITREPQNLVLRDIDEAYEQLTLRRNYFPDTEAAKTSLEHEDSVVIDLNGLELAMNDSNNEYSHFVVNPNSVKNLNSEQRMVAQRIYGPDEENFGLNMELFAEAKKFPYVFVLLPDYVQGALRNNNNNNNNKFLGRASRLDYFNVNSDFDADVRLVGGRGALRRVCRVIAKGDAPKNDVPQAPQEMEKVRSPSLNEILAASRLHVPKCDWGQFQTEIEKLYKP